MSAITPSREARALAARLVWGRVGGPTLTANERALVADGLGGVVLFSRNVESPEQVRGLIDELRAIAPGPIHVAVDQEGGHVVRLREPLTRFPSAMALAATGSERLARAVAAASARELSALGIDVVLAPVLDVALDHRNPALGARTLGSDPARVARLGAAMVEGHLAGGVLPIAKHAPGHGRTPTDSHLGLPVVGGDRRELERHDLPPFAAAVAAGVPGLMTAHVVYEAIDDRPASLSRAVVALLRDDLGFDGLVVTDALVMDAIAGSVAIEQAAIEAIAAGADVALALEPAARVIEALATALERGVLPRARVREAIRHVDAFAARAGGAAADAGWLAHAGLAREVAEASLTLVRDDGLLPLERSASIVLVDFGVPATSPVEDIDRPAGDSTPLGDALRAVLPALEVIPVDGRDLGAFPRALVAAEQAELVILATRDAFSTPEQRTAVDRIFRAGRPVVHLALRSPADLALGDPDAVRAAVAAYGDVPATARALAHALARGRAAFPGRLPMPVPDRSGLDPLVPVPVPVA